VEASAKVLKALEELRAGRAWLRGHPPYGGLAGGACRINEIIIPHW